MVDSVLGIVAGIIWGIIGLLKALRNGEKFDKFKFIKTILIGAFYGWLVGPKAIDDLIQIVGLTAVTDKIINMIKEEIENA